VRIYVLCLSVCPMCVCVYMRLYESVCMRPVAPTAARCQSSRRTPCCAHVCMCCVCWCVGVFKWEGEERGDSMGGEVMSLLARTHAGLLLCLFHNLLILTTLINLLCSAFPCLLATFRALCLAAHCAWPGWAPHASYT
jgi:hypothetical protein